MAKKKSVPKKSAAKKTVAKSSPKKKPPPAVALPPPPAVALPKVRVQMFRQGLGDSFLITFDLGGPAEKRMLIDCGTLGNKFSDTNTAAIAAHLQSLVDEGKKIDILVATHEHQDHVSGFRKDLQAVLKDHVDHVWLAWTENPIDPDAKRIAKHKGDLGAALQLISQVAEGQPVGRQVADLLGFAGDIVLGADFAKTVNEAMEFVRSGTGGETAYHNPGDLLEPDWLPGFRIYVLGPPREHSALKNVGSHDSDELFGTAATLSQAAALHLNTPLGFSGDGGLPFDERYNQSGDGVQRSQYPAYFREDNGWRRIDFEWINGASELALQLDSLTNNTSLALAIERIADGKVLLFPADAQEGNWLSWHDAKIKWSVPDASGAKRDVTAADLLSRTVFYKVGHHGSHNATAKGKGLELMTKQAELVAFIPVDRALALTRNPKDSWQMPARPLYKELLKRCQGRVVRADLGWAAAAASGDDVELMFLNMEEAAQWTEWANHQKSAKHVQVTDPLFFEYVLE